MTRASHCRLRAPAARAQDPRQGRRALRCLGAVLWAVLLVSVCRIGAPVGIAHADTRQEMRSLDEQVQEIKSDVLSIASELNGLEERLLFPSNTQVAVFVSLAEGESFRLDSVQIQIDGELVAHHIYSFKELEALQKGGVQRIYTGNLRSGEHRIDVSVAGKQPGGADFSGSESFSFSKDAEPKLVGITLAGGGSSIQLGGW
jgi:hypothetical protein